MTSETRTLREGVAALRSRWRAAQTAATGRNVAGEKITRAYGEALGYETAIGTLPARAPKSVGELRGYAGSLRDNADGDFKKARARRAGAAAARYLGRAHALTICAEALDTLAQEAVAS